MLASSHFQASFALCYFLLGRFSLGATLEFDKFRVLPSKYGDQNLVFLRKATSNAPDVNHDFISGLNLEQNPAWLLAELSRSMSMEISSNPTDVNEGGVNTSPTNLPDSGQPQSTVSTSPTSAPSISIFPSVSAEPSSTPSISQAPSLSVGPSVAPSVTILPSVSREPSSSSSNSLAPLLSAGPSVAPSMSIMPSDSMEPSSSPSISQLPSLSAGPSAAPSMSMSPSVSMEPSFTPSTSKAPSLSAIPSDTPSLSSLPSDTPSNIPSREPSGQSSPSLFQNDAIFTCTDAGVNMAQLPVAELTGIDIRVGYVVESLSDFVDFEVALERNILAAATVGVLDCIDGGPVFGVGGEVPSVEMTTIETPGVACIPEFSSCTTYQTTFQIVVDKSVDPDLAAFLAYVRLQENMDGGSFTRNILMLDRIEYASPLPLLPPITAPISTQPPASGTREGSLTVSPWTIGAVLAMCMGGTVALWAWARNRQTRNRRHMQLLEDMSVSSPQ